MKVDQGEIRIRRIKNSKRGERGGLKKDGV